MVNEIPLMEVDRPSNEFVEDVVNLSIPNLTKVSFAEKIKNPTYLSFLCIGMGLLWPWNCILSASEYFKHDLFHDDTSWANIFTSSMMSVSTVTSLFFNIWLSSRQVAYSQRVVRGLTWEIVVFCLIILASLFHSLFPAAIDFVWLMCLISISAIGTALTQNGIFAVANVYGAKYTQAVILGQAIAGVLPSLVLFLITLFSKSTNQGSKGIILYFLTTVIVSVSSIILYRMNKIDKILQDVPDNDFVIEINIEGSHVSFARLYAKLKYLALSIFTTFAVTMVFAVFASTVEVRGLPLSNTQFIPLIFLVWNIGDLCGRFLAELPLFSSNDFSPFKTYIYSLLRIGLVPMFFPFLLPPNQMTMTVDLLYILLQFIFGLTNGHVVSMSFMKVPNCLDTDKERKAAGGFNNVFLSTGLAAGSLLSYAFVFIIKRITG